jgi:hypothetical protein
LVATKLTFPDVPDEPGIYRFTLASADSRSVYIGEADRLRRRFAHYRSPGPKQPRNQRMNAAMRAIVESGGTVEVDTADQVRVEIDGRAVVADLSHRPYRLLAENAGLVLAREAGFALENL